MWLFLSIKIARLPTFLFPALRHEEIVSELIVTSREAPVKRPRRSIKSLARDTQAGTSRGHALLLLLAVTFNAFPNCAP